LVDLITSLEGHILRTIYEEGVGKASLYK